LVRGGRQLAHARTSEIRDTTTNGVREEVNWERLRFVNDGAYEWVSDGRIPLARVFRASHAAARDSDDAVTTYPPRRQLAVEAPDRMLIG
jgi:hypothetical protein